LPTAAAIVAQAAGWRQCGTSVPDVNSRARARAQFKLHTPLIDSPA